MTTERLILIIDDDENLRYLGIRQLQKLGYTSHNASSGAEGIEMYSKNEYTMVLMDVMMPGIDGCETAKRMRQFERDNGRPRTPIVVMTAHSESKFCLNSDIDDYVFKPVMLDTMKSILHRWLTVPS